jgi:hypothetical protein
MLAQDDAITTDVNSMFSLRGIVLIGYSFSIRENPFAFVDHIAEVDNNAHNVKEALVNNV